MTRLRPILVCILTAALALPVFVGTTSADHPHVIPCLIPILGCPDLTVDGTRFDAYIQTRTFSTTNCDVVEGMVQPGTRELLRFTFTTPNIGLVDLVVGSPVNNPAFYFSPCHGHYHFIEYGDYRLWEPAQFDDYQALRVANPGVQAHEILEAHPELTPAKGDKRGFCVIDLVRYSPYVPARWTSCSSQGISAGWADEYYHTLGGQYVDVTDLPAGEYVLEAEVNSEQLYEESDYDNNRAWETVTIP